MKRKEKWQKMYNLAKAYYEHYGNLKIPYNFKTKNGYEYDENGENLGIWVTSKRDIYHSQKRGNITNEQIDLLEQIEIIWNVHEETFDKMYNLAKAYYEHYGNLKVPYNFKTKNGYEYDENGENLGIWISNKKSVYKGYNSGTLSEYQIKLLEKIEITWFSENIDKKKQAEIITEKNKERKERELLNRLQSYLIILKIQKIFSKRAIDEISRGFLKQLK